MTTRASTTLKKEPQKRRRKPQAKNWRAAFLAALKDCGNVREACEIARVDRTASYRARDNDAAFALKWDEAMKEACDALESEARRRAVGGVEEPVGFYRGEPAAYVKRYSDVLLIFLLKAHDPARFRDNFSIEHTGKDGGPIETHDTRTAEEQEAAIEKLLELRSRSDVRAGK